jgi:hypothetical protein
MDVSPTVQKPKPSLRHVFYDQPSSYWTGRFIALNDRLMTEARDIPDPRDDDGISKMLSLEVKRARHIFDLLEDDCQNKEAKASLMVSLLSLSHVCSFNDFPDLQANICTEEERPKSHASRSTKLDSACQDREGRDSRLAQLKLC